MYPMLLDPTSVYEIAKLGKILFLEMVNLNYANRPGESFIITMIFLVLDRSKKEWEKKIIIGTINKYRKIKFKYIIIHIYNYYKI